MDETSEWVEYCARELLLGDKGWGECKVLGGLLEPATQSGVIPKIEVHMRKRN